MDALPKLTSEDEAELRTCANKAQEIMTRYFIASGGNVGIQLAKHQLADGVQQFLANVEPPR
jgi:hypothetical protein